MSEFPTDEVTLSMLEAACQPDAEGPSTVTTMLAFGAEHVGVEDGIDVYEGGYHPNEVILALVAEVRRLRD